MTHFITSETGAVTVDWVVLTAGLVGLGLATMSVVSSGVQTASDNTSDQLAATQICTNFQQCEHRAFYHALHLMHDSGTFPADDYVATNFAHVMAELEDTSASGTEQILENYQELTAEEDGRAAQAAKVDAWNASGQSFDDYAEIFSPGVDPVIVQNNLNFTNDTPASAVAKVDAWNTYYGAVQDTYEAELSERGAL